MNKSIASSHSKINPSNPQRSKQRRPRPHGHPQPTRYRPPAPPRPARYALDVGRNISLALTLEKNRIAPNALTVARIGGGE